MKSHVSMAQHQYPFRGWLCGCCNTAFGRLGDSFEEVAQRLERYKLTVNQGDQ